MATGIDVLKRAYDVQRDDYNPRYATLFQPPGLQPVAVTTRDNMANFAIIQFKSSDRGTKLIEAVANSYRNGWGIKLLRPFVYTDYPDQLRGVLTGLIGQMADELEFGPLSVTGIGPKGIDVLRRLDTELHPQAEVEPLSQPG